MTQFRQGPALRGFLQNKRDRALLYKSHARLRYGGITCNNLVNENRFKPFAMAKAVHLFDELTRRCYIVGALKLKMGPHGLTMHVMVGGDDSFNHTIQATITQHQATNFLPEMCIKTFYKCD
ncbi:uncharacterized protein PHALS_03809 [Plasmopara halstedii]|uniref:Uncharacterized protein n=1 Tax=Plasmopara halstedii TaxID=4781 RepID=A0A0P1AZM2_PLAHL|nr:uncharacterized protein PHALS_03809 [Plasmopara halstedii]CEG47159.1 hypothetical protein PHALS_03809 [Plasmopara halstedii]|eukprot:XP_024583528.1 hypothetical protein PHALS_03809 [Plasmopara halstedii]